MKKFFVSLVLVGVAVLLTGCAAGEYRWVRASWEYRYLPPPTTVWVPVTVYPSPSEYRYYYGSGGHYRLAPGYRQPPPYHHPH